MTLTRTQNQPTAGQTRYRFDYSGTTAAIDKKADQAARWLYTAFGYGDQSKPYDQHALAEKLAILDKYVLNQILQASKNYAVPTATEAARLSAIAAEESEVLT